MIIKTIPVGFSNSNFSINKTKNVSFKELDDCDFCSPAMNGREEIEHKYAQRREALAHKADWLEMPSDIYFEELKKINDAEKEELDNYEYSIRNH